VVFETDFDQLYRFSDFVFRGYHFGTTNGNEGRRFELEFSNHGGATFQPPATVERELGSHAFRNAAPLALGVGFDANFDHLQSAPNLNFLSIRGSTFTGSNPVPPVPVSGPRLFIRIAEGPAPIR
jgi:hypothetical protein